MQRSYYRVLGLSFLLLCTNVFAEKTQPAELRTPPPDVEVLHDVVMGNGGNRPLVADLAFPKIAPKESLPVILMIHGGGWSGGTHRFGDNPPIARVRKGFVVVSPEYRLSGEAQWPAQLEDVKLAVRWIRANAAKYHADPNRIIAWGSSAGGHLAACLGTMHDPQYEGKGGYDGVSSEIQMVIDNCGPTNFTQGKIGLGSDTVDEEHIQKGVVMLEKLFGFPYDENPAAYQQASPLFHVDSTAPPFFIFHGRQDQIVSYKQAQSLADALQKAGVPTRFILVKGARHCQWPGPRKLEELNGRSITEVMDEYIQENLKAMQSSRGLSTIQAAKTGAMQAASTP